MTVPALPLLYSFRRCPYAIRARMAMYASGIRFELHEVSLKSKPESMLLVSSKGTVPVLCADGDIIDESLDIMFWALKKSDPEGWLTRYTQEDVEKAMVLIEANDNEFKARLDKYKYASRFPEQSPEYYRQRCTVFLQRLETILKKQQYLLGESLTLVDVAIFPFIRQFSMVEQGWFEASEYTYLKAWLYDLLCTPLFIQVMKKS